MIPLSYAQRRLWFLNRLEGASSTYNAPVVVRLDGVPDAAALAAALGDLVARHEVLRTVLPVADGEPYQKVLDVPGGLLTVVPCAAAEADTLVPEFCGETFDLLVDLPLRVKLFVTDAGTSVLVLLLHHAATDGWSLGPLLRDLAEAYTARLAGEATGREPLEVQYADYALWQRDLLGEASDPDSEAAEQLEYWRAALDGAPERLALPADRPHPAEPSGRGGLAVGRIGPGTHARLRALARERRASLFMVLHAALAAALATATGQRDVSIGTAVAGRSTEEALEDVVGFFVNTLVLRTEVPGGLAFGELVGRVRESDLGAFAHQDLPFDLLVEHLNPERSPGRHPFFQVMLTLDGAPATGFDLGGVPGRIEPVDLRAAKFDLTVFCAEIPDAGGLEIWWQYAEDLFDSGTARLLLDLFTRVLEAVAADPAVRVDALDVLSAEERAGLEERRREQVPAADAEPSAAPASAVTLTPRQEILAGLFAEALGLPFVGGHDNFFRSGGHSLLGVRLVNRVRAVLGVEVGIRDLFLTPTVVGLDARIGEAAGAGRPALTRVDRSGPLPLSFAQRRLWFAHQLEGPGRSYNIPVVLRLDRPVDPVVLERALGDVVERHEVLRSVFTLVDGEPYQDVRNGVRPRLELVRTTEAEAEAVVDGLAGYTFDVGAEQPIRAALVETVEGGRILVVVLHHIAGDGWSLGRLLADLGEAYGARAAGEAPGWGPLPVQYGDYAVWQRELLGKASDPESPLSRRLAYWRETLDGAPPVLELPGHRARPAVAGHRGDLTVFELDAAAHRTLARLAAASGATLFMVVQAAFAVVLNRLGAGEDLPIGTVVAGRDDEALHDLVGFFVNTLVLRTDVSGDPTFTELVERVRSTDLAAYAHQEVPFDLLVERLNPVRSAAHHPLVQVMLSVQTDFRQEMGDSPLAGSEVSIDSGAAKLDLTVAIRERRDPLGAPDGLLGVVECAADLFDPGTADLVARLLNRVLTAAAEAPGSRIADLELADPGEPAAAPALPARPDATLPALFATRAAERPDAVAVVAEDLSLTYAELDAASAAVASRLTDRNVGRGSVVAVLLTRGLPLAVAVLAIARSGAAHVLLDPDADPAPLLAESRADLLVCAPGHRPAGGPPVLLMDAEHVDHAGKPVAPCGDPGEPGDPGDAVCVMLAEAGPGEVRAVLASHRAVAAATADAGEHVRLQWGPVSWGSFAAEFWGALASGGTCVLAPEARPSAARIADLVVAHGVTALALPARVLGHLADTRPEALSGLREVVVTGTPEHEGQRARICRLLDGARVVPAPDLSGHPLESARRYVLDARLRPVPAGAPGELYLAGDGLAEGFPAAPGRSAERFVADPFRPGGGRMLRTGALVRRVEDGTLRHLGPVADPLTPRPDTGAVEAVLLRSPGVRDAAVVLRDGRLVAYAVPAPNADLAGLRDHVAGTLAGPLVPSAVVVVPALPLDAHGELDDAALPAPEEAASRGRAPSGPVEEFLAALFTELLDGRPVGVDDNFFKSGGYSLLAIRLLNRIRATFPCEITLRDVFQAPTVAALAARLQTSVPPEPSASPAPAAEARPALRRRTRGGARLRDEKVPG
ncbi:condensation domain-containing protein [Actinocorallia aurantiaca]|uniref:Carrier domain-containing protein n=1 Tax=Actinocorallia aurantiaca TaxID=46204 RepID=A0ABN3USF1_9ACTN